MYELVFTFDIKEYKKNDAILRYINDNYPIFKKKHILFKINIVDTIITDNDVLNTQQQGAFNYPMLNIPNGDKSFNTYKSIFEYIFNLKADLENEHINITSSSNSKKLFNQSMDSNDISKRMYLDSY